MGKMLLWTCIILQGLTSTMAEGNQTITRVDEPRLRWSAEPDEGRSIFLLAWSVAIKAVATGEGIPKNQWLALDVLDTLAKEVRDPVLWNLTYEARKRTLPFMRRYAGYVQHHEDRFSALRAEFTKEKEIVRRGHRSWDYFNWKITQDALENNETELLEFADWKLHNSTELESTPLDEIYQKPTGQYFWKASNWRNATNIQASKRKLIHHPAKRNLETTPVPEQIPTTDSSHIFLRAYN